MRPHLIDTLIKESQASVFVTDEGALLYETAEHLSLHHEGVKPLMGALSALQEAYDTYDMIVNISFHIPLEQYFIVHGLD